LIGISENELPESVQQEVTPMKQSEMGREVRRVAKAAAKMRGWKSVDGTLYWTIGPLFFSLVQTAGAKEGSYYGSLRFKWLELDRVFWRVLGMSSNEREPFSLHANGAFVLSGQELHSTSVRSLEWLPGVLEDQVHNAMQSAFTRANEVASQISSIRSYLDFIQREHEALMQRHPRAAVNVWKETLLVAMLEGDMPCAAQIASSRIAAGDSGGYSSDGKSFFEHAQALCEREVWGGLSLRAPKEN
jgi:hypothetical protein